MIRILALALCGISICSGSIAAERVRLGYGRLVTNDLLGDGADRWRSGSVASSRVWGPEWTGSLPSGFYGLIWLDREFKGQRERQVIGSLRIHVDF